MYEVRYVWFHNWVLLVIPTVSVGAEDQINALPDFLIPN
jgi:hypothetical protein